MNKCLLIVFVVLFSSCRQYDTNTRITLPNGVGISLHEGEIQNRKQSAFLITDYFSLFKEENTHQIPLYRTVEHGDYRFFIGLPYGKYITKIFEEDLVEESYALVKKEKKNNISYKIYNKENQYIVEFAERIENNLIYILAVTDKKKVLENTLSLSGFISRIGKH